VQLSKSVFHFLAVNNRPAVKTATNEKGRHYLKAYRHCRWFVAK